MAQPLVTVADKLRAELRQTGWSVRELGRRLDPDNPEQARRYVHRWLRETLPDDEWAERLAVVFDKPLDYFKVTRADLAAESLALRERMDQFEDELRQLREHLTANPPN